MLFAKRDFVLCMYLVRGSVGYQVASTRADVIATEAVLLMLDLFIVGTGSITLCQADRDGPRQVVASSAIFK